MNNLIHDFASFIKSLNLIDVLFIVAILGLVVLIVTLIYVVKMNNQEELEIFEEDDYTDLPKKIEEEKNDNIEEFKEDNDEELNLADISKEIEEKKIKPITLNDYEKEQEEKAIISYDELIQTKEIPLEEINYKSEEDIDGLTVKSVDTDNLTKPIELPQIKEKIENNESKNILVSYEKEEEFLEVLKKLDRLLN